MNYPEFKPLNLAQLYQHADASVAQAMQTGMMAMQAGRMRQEYDQEDALRTLARSSVQTDESGNRTLDLKSFASGAMGIDPIKGIAISGQLAAQEKAGLERENLQGQIDERRFKSANDRLKIMGDASTGPYLEWKKLTDGGMPDAEARAKVQPMYQAAVQNLSASGMFTRQQLEAMKIMKTPEFDPDIAKAGMDQVLGAKDSIAQYWNERNFGQKERHHGDSMRLQIAGQEITVSGQKLTDARAREQLAQSLKLGRLEVDKERGVVIDKITNQTYPITTQGGAALPPRTGDVEGLRKEFNAREEVKNYNAAVPILRSITQAPKNPAGDLDFIYGVGKILDPNSVVREGEMTLVIKSGSPLQRILGTGNWVAGQGKLTEGMREELLGMLHSRTGELRQAAEDAKKPFAAQAKRQNIPEAETLTLPELPALPAGKGAAGKIVQTYATEADAAAAAKSGKLKDGTKIRIGNQTGIWKAD